MNPLLGLVGALVGGAMTLAATYLTQRATSRREAERHEREEAARREWELRLAYAEWLAANQRAMVLITAMDAMPKEKQDGIALAQHFSTDMAVAGSKVRLLETDLNARLKIAEAMQIISVFAAKVSTGGPDFMATLLEVDATARKLGELEWWVLSNRFPPKTGESPKPAPEVAAQPLLPGAAK
jgi:hypothetical protein